MRDFWRGFGHGFVLGWFLFGAVVLPLAVALRLLGVV